MKTIFRFVIVISFFAAGIFYCNVLNAQITFQKTYGGPNDDGTVGVNPDCTCARQTTDGGYVLTGSTSSFGAGNYDVYLIKINAAGDTLWTKTFGGVDKDIGRTVQQTSDGGYIVAGQSYSFTNYSSDIYLIRTDSNGDTLWTRTYSAGNNSGSFAAQQTADGGFIITGSVSGFYGLSDLYLVKTDAGGNILWTKIYGGNNYDDGLSVQQTSDGGYIVTGDTRSFTASSEVYLVRTDAAGDTLWTRTYGGDYFDWGNSVQQTTDGGFIITGYKGEDNNSFLRSVYLIKTDANGDTLWTKTYKRYASDEARWVEQTNDGGYIVVGKTVTSGSSCDIYLIKTHENGDTIWTRTFGAFGDDRGYSVHQTSDSGYIIAGMTTSFGAGLTDFYIIKTNPKGNTICQEQYPHTIVSNPACTVTRPQTLSASAGIVGYPATQVGRGGPVGTICFTTGVTEILQPNPISLSPNPTTTTTTLAFQFTKPEQTTITLFNLLGEKIKSFPSQAFSAGRQEVVMDVSDLPQGTYLVCVATSEGRSVMKIMKE